MTSLVKGSFTLLAAVAVLAVVAGPAHAQSCSGNAIYCENQKAGTPQEDWDTGDGDDTIQGFAADMSVNKGSTISFKVKSTATSYKIDIYRIGYYGGAGARLVQGSIPKTAAQDQITRTQPNCMTYAGTGLIDCGNWGVSATWAVPSTAVSGVYMARLERNGGGASSIWFVVRDDSSTAPISYQTSDQTWVAYNAYGGNSTYVCTISCPPDPKHSYLGASKVSYNRPLVATGDRQNSFMYDEYPMVRFLERNGYDLSYSTGVDNNSSRGALIKNHKLFISSGHDEYWSSPQRANVESARNAGVNLAFFSGNEMYWRTRFENSPVSTTTTTTDRTLSAYKDTHYDAEVDPVSWTGTWRDPRFTTAADGILPENALIGQSFVVNSGTSAIEIPFAYKNLRMWRNTPIASLTSGQTYVLADKTLGYEWDVDADNGYRPAGAFRLSDTTRSNVETLLDFGSEFTPTGTARHNMTLYKAPSGALVFGAGTVQWSWGLDTESPTLNPEDAKMDAMQQATVNLFADMGVQPTSLMSTLVAATKTNDTVAPTATISSPPSSVSDGATVSLSGTATDTGGGIVGGVEISTDNGATWHPTNPGSNGYSSWNYSWFAHGAPSTVIKVRATDDSGNLGAASAGSTVTVNCPCGFFGDKAPETAAARDSGDTQSVEVGFKFTSDVLGTVSSIRFYKATTNTGTHVGSIWSASGVRLASATFTNETASGWQRVTFATPVDIQPNTTYVASYFAPSGHYSGSNDYYWRTASPGPNGGGFVDAGPLHAVKSTDGTGTSVNGVYSYGAFSTFPSSSYKNTNYWIDVDFTVTPPPGQVTNVVAASGGLTSANLTWNAPATGGNPSSYRITPYVGTTAQAPRTVPATDTSATVTGLTNGTTYTFRVAGVNANGTGPDSSPSNAVTPLNPVVPAPPTSVAARPATNSAQVTWTLPSNNGDSAITSQTVTPYREGVAQAPVQASATATSATITGLDNGYDYTFRVRATNGVGAGPQSSESNEVTPQTTIFNFQTPTTIDSGDAFAVELGMKFTADHNGSITGVRFYKAAANTGTHIGNLWTTSSVKLASATFTNETASGWQTVTFATPVAVTAGTTYVASYFTQSGHNSATSNGMTSAIENGPLSTVPSSVSANGVYAMSGTSSFPSNSHNATNYWVDVMYALPQPGTPTSVAAVAGGTTSAHVTWTAPSSGGPVSSYRITPFVGVTAQTPTTVPATADTSATVTGLTTGTTYTFKVEAVNANGPGPISAASNAVTPQTAVAPAPPTNVSARPATNSAQVSWTLSGSDGDSPITGQTVTPYIGSVAQTPVQVSATVTSVTVSGLTNGTDYTFRVRATNAIGSGSSAPSAVVTPQSTLFDFTTPTNVDSGDTLPVELGVKFKADYNGTVTGIRFYKASTNTGTHIGNLWATDGTRLATATFAGETASGWQTVKFASPVSVTAGTTYVASYFTASGHNSYTGNGLSAAIDRGPLHTIANSVSPNGVYARSSTSTFPASTYNATNYWVDVMFALQTPGQVTGVSAVAAGTTSAQVSWTAPASGGPVSSYRITPYAGTTAGTSKTVPATETTTTVTGLTSGTTYTFRVEAINANGAGPASAASNTVTPQNPVAPVAPTNVAAEPATNSALVTWTASSDGDSPITSQTITPYIGAVAQTPIQVSGSATSATIAGLVNSTSYTFRVRANNAIGSSPQSSASSSVTPQSTLFDFSTPTTIDSGDAFPVELGMKFKADYDGWITGVRFYKSAANTGTHIGSLWSTSGSRLATATFSDETSTGWQSVTFANRVAVTAGTTYVVSYFTPTGHNAFTSAAMASPIDRGPLHSIASSVSANGVYAMGSSSSFPVNAYNATNYWVDALYELPAPGAVTGAAATTAGSTSAHVTWDAPTSGGPIASYRITPFVGTTAQAPTTVPATSDTAATVTGLTTGTTYTFRVEAFNANGAGAGSTSNAVTPQTAVVPSPPTNVTARPATSSALVSWALPGSNGDSPITSQTVTPYVNGVAQTPVQVGASATSVTISGLTNDTAYTFRVYATNAIGNSAQSTASSAVTPGITLFDFQTPTSIDSGDTLPVELGMKFTADVAGYIKGVRFYKAAANTGTHIGSLWSTAGARLTTATFSNETPTGWQTVTFASPVQITAGTTYIASYFTPTGHNSYTSNGFQFGFDRAPLHVLANSVSPNGVYAQGGSSSFPANSYSATNYWVDVLFAPLSP